MSADDYAVCVRPDERGYAEVCAQRDELLVALEMYVMMAETTGWTPGDRNRCLDRARAAIARCKETSLRQGSGRQAGDD